MNGTHFPEQEMVRLFKGTCEAIRAMRTYRAPVGATLPKGGNAGSSYAAAAKQKQQQRQQQHDDDERFPQPEGDGEGGYSYDSRW
jgi:serine/threonine kinase 16